MRLKTKSVGIIAAVFFVVLGASYLLFGRMKNDIMSRLGAVYAEKQVLYNRARVLHPLMRELALAQKLADSSALRAWARDEADPALRATGLRELEDYRRFFSDGSFFFVAHRSGHYYFNDRDDRYAATPLRYTLDPKKAADHWYYGTVESGAPYKLNVDFDEKLRVTKVWINVVVRDKGVPLGVVGTGIDLSEFLAAAVSSDQPGVANMFVEEGGAIQAHASVEEIDFRTISKEPSQRKTVFHLLDEEGDRNRLRAAMDRLRTKAGDNVEIIFARVNGKRHLLGLTFLQAIGWYNVTLMDTERMLGARRFVPFALLLLAALVVLSTSLVMMLNRFVIERISRLDDSMREFARGATPVPLAAEARDEMGRLEAGFQQMALTLRESADHLEDKVAARTLELAEKNEKLEKALAEISTLSGLLSTCSYCKKIRDQEGHWNTMESYISQRTTAKFSHGICPDCMARARMEIGSSGSEK